MAIVFDDRTGHDEPRPPRSGRPATDQRRATPPARRPARRHGSTAAATATVAPATTPRRPATPTGRRTATPTTETRTPAPSAKRSGSAPASPDAGSARTSGRTPTPTSKRAVTALAPASGDAGSARTNRRSVPAPSAKRAAAVPATDEAGRRGEPAPSAKRAAPAPAAKRRSPAPRPVQLDGTPVGEVLPPRPLRSLRPQRPEHAATPDVAPAAKAAPSPSAEPAGRKAAPTIRRASPMRTRTHGGANREALRTTVWAPPHDQPMVRLTAGIVAGPPPPLVVVPRRRRVSRLITVGFAVVFALMLGAAALQTRLAGRQVELDKVERSIRDANQQYNELRRQRSELRAPERLATEAAALGMRPASSTDFVTIDPAIVAIVQQSSGGVFDTNATVLDPLDEFGRVKAIAGEAP